MARRKGETGALAWLLAVVAFAGPAVVFLAAMGVRFGPLDYATGHDLLALRVAPITAAVGGVAGLILVFLALRRRAGWLIALVALAAAGLTLGASVWHASRLAAGPPDDITSDLAEVPGFGSLDERRAGPGPSARGGLEACPGALPAMTQVAPEAAVWALQEAGFSLQGNPSVSRAAGTHRGFWFGATHDAVIRIRPGRTDVRVAARDGRPHGGEACRLATAISEGLRRGEG